ncbi:MAG: GNAT family N-acetyltransferase [Ruminiclostridium sp.]|nr:GNAT family N-acetyltransferase [Ruminiclostridium sp.]
MHTENDIAFIASLEYECFAEPWDAQTVRTVADDPDGICVYMQGTGYALGKLAADEAELYRIAVVPGRRGRGFGGLIIDRFISECAGRGASRVFLEVRSKNVRAISLYERKSFIRIGVRKGYYPDDDAVLYELEI